jgi:predicted Fe-S protein YdhL (DUF1289 family)
VEQSEFIPKRNIELFQEKLKIETNDQRRAVLEQLLQKERAKLKKVDAASRQA